jgi:hypothetical protein
MDFFELFMQLPSMNPFPGPDSIMIVDNCSTHKSNAVRDAVEAAVCLDSLVLPLLLKTD